MKIVFCVSNIKSNNPKNNIVVVSPDVGGVVRSRALAKQLNDADLAIIDKRRAAANQSEVMNIIGDIKDKVCIVPDDIIDTAGTLCNAAKALKDQGAAGVKAYITHPVLSGPAIERLNNSEIDELVVTNSIPLSQEGEKCRGRKIPCKYYGRRQTSNSCSGRKNCKYVL